MRAFGHGIEETGGVQSHAAERPTDFWRFLISAAEATARVRIDETAGYRYITADALPDHATGQFPNRGNPNSIRAQHLSYRVPLRPQKAASPTPLGHQPFGVALNGVPFDPLTAEYWNSDRRSGWNIEALSGKLNLGLDRNNAHVQPDGTYHYHGVPTGLMERFATKDAPVLLGYAADGFPIYGPWGPTDAAAPSGPMINLKPSFRIKTGVRPNGPGGRYDGTYVQDYEYAPGAGVLDACNGRTGVTPQYPRGTYYYVLTTAYPFIPRCFAGTPDPSFERKPPAGGRMGPGGRPNERLGGGPQNGFAPRGGPPDLDRAARTLGISPQALRQALGPPPPDFDGAARALGVSREALIDALHPDGGGPPR